MEIFVNGESKIVVGPTLSHEDICLIAGEPPFASVTYSGPRRGDAQRSGMTSPGKSIEVEDGMRITCIRTGNA